MKSIVALVILVLVILISLGLFVAGVCAAEEQQQGLILDQQQAEGLWHAVYRGAQSTFCDMLAGHFQRADSQVGAPKLETVFVTDPLLTNPLDNIKPEIRVDLLVEGSDPRGFSKAFELLTQANRIREAAKTSGFKRVILYITKTQRLAGLLDSELGVCVYVNWNDHLGIDTASEVIAFIKTHKPQSPPRAIWP